MQPTGIGSGLIRGLVNLAPDLMTELFAPNRVLEADVISVFRDQALLSLGKGVRVEVTLQAQLKEGQHVRLQVQPREAGAPIVLKLIGGGGTPEGAGQVLVQRATQGQQGQAQAQGLPIPGQPEQPAVPGQPAAPGQAGAASQALNHAAAGTAQSQESATTQNQPGMANLQWLPIPLSNGAQAWAQIHVQEEPSKQARSRSGQPVHTVRLYWETPLLGPIQVTMDAAETSLTALFTIAQTESRRAIAAGLPDLQTRLHAAGFTDSRLAARPSPPGEAPGPMRPDETGLLNRRL